MHLLIKPENDEVSSMYSNHGSYHVGDSGLDLFTTEDLIVPAKTLAATINFMIKCEAYMDSVKEQDQSNMMNMPNLKIKVVKIQEGEEASETTTKTLNYNKPTGYWLVPRSSISNTPLRMSNSIGLIDAKYRGYIMAKVDNLSEHSYHIAKGTRLFQLVGPTLEPITFELVNQLSDTSRGEGGFGSTGSK